MHDLEKLLRRTSPKPSRTEKDLRVSSEDQDEEKQRGLIQRWADDTGVKIALWFADHGISAFSDDVRRVEFWRMVELAKSERPDFILAKDSQRFFRNRYGSVRH